MEKGNPAKAIIIAGMHRSGTSALSRTLNLVGCDAPNTLMGGDNRGNERGHWESQPIFELNNELLASAGSSWEDWEAINPSWYASPLYPKYFEKSLEVLTAEFGSSPLFVVKDPRFCRLMDFWTKVIESFGASPLVIMPIRNPQDVAASLKHRDAIDPSVGRLLWLRHVLEAEAGSRGYPRVTVRFDQLLNDWRGLVTRIGEALEVSWPNMSSAADMEVDDFLTPDLRHHADPRDDVEPNTPRIRWIAETYEILQKWSAGEERSSDLAKLDEIRSNLNALGPLFGRPILLGRRAMRDARELNAKREELTDLLDAERTKVNGLQETLAQRQAEVETLRQSIAQKQAEVESLQQSNVQELESLRRSNTKELETLQRSNARELETLHQSIAHKAEEIARQEARIIDQDQAIGGHVREQASLSDTLANTRDQIDALMSAVNERERRIATLLQSSSWRYTAPLRNTKLGLAWLLRKVVRIAQIGGWLCTGQFRKAAHAALPFYRRHAPRWVGALIPRRLRQWLRVSTSSPSNAVLQSLQHLDQADRYEHTQFVPEFRGSPPDSNGVRLIAFYLPQFHPIPENDAWWGEGFTEWTNVRAAKPLFAGHYQPRVPIDSGHYDLRDPDVQHRQVDLAKRYGVSGFCFYFYWFAGHRLLETPLLNYLNDPAMDLPFCLCWANENWTRRWDGREQDLLIGQRHSESDDLQFIEYVSLYLNDSRYIRIDNRPLLLVYKPDLFPDAAATVRRWREWCREHGVGELYVAMVQSLQDLDPRPYGMDAAIEFPWHTGLPNDITTHVLPPETGFSGYVFDWDDYAAKCHEQPDRPWTQVRGVMPGWDNTPRLKSAAHLFQGHSPATYSRWLVSAMRWTLDRMRKPEERLVFINAWNEWGEGAYLEPDQRFGYAFLQATRDAVEAVARQPTNPVRPHPLSTGAQSLIVKQVVPMGSKQTASVAGIRLKCPAEPDISVVIPVYGECQLTLRCLKSLSDLSDRRSFEVVLVDDASEDESAERLSAVPGIRYLRNDENQGFLKSCNRGAAVAQGRYLFLLNNDTVVENGALDALADTFDDHDNVGLVGAKLYFEDGRLQEAGGIVWSDGSAMNYGRGDDPRKPEYNYVRDADYCSGAAIMLPTVLWRRLNGFDSYYVRAYYEDTDLALRVRQAGRRVLYQPFAKVVHREGATSGTDLSKGEKRYQVENRKRFLERWRDKLASDHPAPTTPPQLAKDRGAAARALVIDWDIPTPDHDSGSLDTFNLIRMLNHLGVKTTFAAHRDLAYFGEYTDAVQKLGAEVLYAPYCNSLRTFLQEHGKEQDYVIVHRVGVFKEVQPELKRFCPQARIIFSTVDLHHIREARQAEVENSQRLRKKAEATKRDEIKLARKADATIVVSKTEQALLEEALPTVPVFHMPLIRDVPGLSEAAFDSRRGIGFLGNYLHPPNMDAVLHFVHDIWPEFRSAVPHAELYIGGGQMPSEVAQLSDLEGVQTLGYVPDLAAFYNRIRLTVAPLRYGAGAKGKVVSSLCHGVPVVASPIAAEGMDVAHGRDILIAGNQAEWIEHLESAYCDPILWRALSEGGTATMQRNHSLTTGVVELSRILALDEVDFGRKAAPTAL
ncbi:MAG: glycosyltransferase [Gammaproteobacteria bacterium]|nr:glycosyltransferase [Gammaproteobacteria bacterium]MYK84458.1 glycosyltransferase [Gammaproteobacteria bacterium]